MNTLENLLTEFKVQAFVLADACVHKFKKAKKEKPDQVFETHFEIVYTDFKKQLAHKSLDVIKKSIREGYEGKNEETTLQLSIGIEKINLEVVGKLIKEVSAENSKYGQYYNSL